MGYDLHDYRLILKALPAKYRIPRKLKKAMRSGLVGVSMRERRMFDRLTRWTSWMNPDWKLRMAAVYKAEGLE